MSVCGSGEVESGEVGLGMRDVPAPATEVGPGEEIVLPLVEETVRIGKRVVETGRVRVQTHTETVEQVLRENLHREVVGITRVPIDRTLAAGEPVPAVREEGGVTIVPVLEEILVVEKHLVLKEEVHIHRTAGGEDVEVPVTLRRQRAVVERLSPEGQVVGQPTEQPASAPPKETPP